MEESPQLLPAWQLYPFLRPSLPPSLPSTHNLCPVPALVQALPSGALLPSAGTRGGGPSPSLLPTSWSRPLSQRLVLELWERSPPQEAGSECPCLSPQRNATQKLSWAQSTAGLRARASVHRQVGQGPKGDRRTAGEVKGELLSEPRKAGSDSRVRGAGAGGPQGAPLTLAPPPGRCQAARPWDAAGHSAPSACPCLPHTTNSQDALGRLASATPGEPGLWPQLLLCPLPSPGSNPPLGTM